MRCALPLLILLACGPPPEVAPPDDGACVERVDPLRQDERTPFGVRPNQLRAAIGGPVEGITEGGQTLVVTPDWSGGQALQVWAQPVDGVPAPDPEPPLWCRDRTDLPVLLRAEGDALAETIEQPGVIRAVGPLTGLEVGFVGPARTVGEPAREGPAIWVWWSEGRGEIRLPDQVVPFTFEPPG